MADILAVEDTNSNLRLLHAVLERDGHHLYDAPTLSVARDLLSSQPFDLILLDLLMIDGFGLELAHEVRSNPATAAIPIIVVSASVMDSVRMAARSVGCNKFLTKPVEPQVLLAAVRDLCRAPEAASEGTP